MRIYIQESIRRIRRFLLSAQRYEWVSYAIPVAAVFISLAFGEKFWRKNDDMHMAMIAHGYGITDAASPGIVYSNVIWGWIVEHLGTIAGIQGYTIGIYGLVALSFVVLLGAFLWLRVPSLLGSAVLTLMFVPVILGMQFTIASGYLAVSGFALAIVATGKKRAWPWPCAVLLLILSALVRWEEFFFICLMALPFCWAYISRHAERQVRLRWIAMACLVFGAVGVCTFINHAYYTSDGWSQFRETNKLRRPFTNYDLSEFYIRHPSRLRSSDVKLNDMRLMDQWFYLDDRVFNSSTLSPLIKNVSISDLIRFNVRQYRRFLSPFHEIGIMYLSGIFLLVMVLGGRGRRAGLIAAGMLLAIMTVFWLLGRPGINHVYVPAVALLAVLTLVGNRDMRQGFLTSVVSLVVLAAVTTTCWHLYRSRAYLGTVAAQGRSAICSLSHGDLQILWDWETPGGVQDRFVYRPTFHLDDGCRMPLYSIGVFQLLPGTLKQLHAYTGGKGFMQALLAGQHFYFLTSRQRLHLLDVYMQRHYKVKLDVKPQVMNKYVHQYLVSVIRS